MSKVALIAMKRLVEIGCRVPTDVSLAACDNLSSTEHLPVPLNEWIAAWICPRAARCTSRIRSFALRAPPGAIGAFCTFPPDRTSFDTRSKWYMRLILALWIIGNPRDLALIDTLDADIQRRFQMPNPDALGMSRIVRPNSFGRHFTPAISSIRDFEPESARERTTLAELEARRIKVAFYAFGERVEQAPAGLQDFRSLKGPAAITRDTRRAPGPPSWAEMYPVAQRAMRSFHDGGRGFEAHHGEWNIAVRPVIANQQGCVACHNNPVHGAQPPAKLDAPLGGVVYAWRREGS